jgi:hypothetical protein
VPVSHRKYFFKSPLYMAFPTAPDPAGRAVGPLSPLPCQAWHGYGASSAHHGEVRGCRRDCERTPLRGRRRCAAGGRRISILYVVYDSFPLSRFHRVYFFYAIAISKTFRYENTANGQNTFSKIDEDVWNSTKYATKTLQWERRPKAPHAMVQQRNKRARVNRRRCPVEGSNL